MIKDDGAIAGYRREPPAKPKVEVTVAQPDVVGGVLDTIYLAPRPAFEPVTGCKLSTHRPAKAVLSCCWVTTCISPVQAFCLHIPELSRLKKYSLLIQLTASVSVVVTKSRGSVTKLLILGAALGTGGAGSSLGVGGWTAGSSSRRPRRRSQG
jgi:hypothetical protein